MIKNVSLMPVSIVNLLDRAQDPLDVKSQEGQVQHERKNWKTKNKNMKINVSNTNIFDVVQTH
jgi:hypothetical protein